MKLCKRIAAFIVAAAMLSLCAGAFAAYEPDYPEVPEGYDGYITFAVSAITMGWCYVMDPILVPVNEGETLAAVTDRVFAEYGVDYTAYGTVEDGFYLTGVACYDKEPDVPAYLMTEIENYPAWSDEQFGFNYGGWTGEYDDDDMLTMGEYCDLSGWMYTEDNIALSDGADVCTVKIGSVYTWFFSIYGWGMDYGVSDGWGSFPTFDNPMEGVDRTEVSRVLAQLTFAEDITDEMLENAIDELERLVYDFYSPKTDQAELDAALAALLEALDIGGEPTEYEVGDVNMDGSVDSADALVIMRAAMRVYELNEAETALADFNGDGAIDMTDALLVFRAAA